MLFCLNKNPVDCFFSVTSAPSVGGGIAATPETSHIIQVNPFGY